MTRTPIAVALLLAGGVAATTLVDVAAAPPADVERAMFGGSYIRNMVSDETGLPADWDVKVTPPKELRVKGRDIVFFDDVISTGKTAIALAQAVRRKRPRSMRLFTVWSVALSHSSSSIASAASRERSIPILRASQAWARSGTSSAAETSSGASSCCQRASSSPKGVPSQS